MKLEELRAALEVNLEPRRLSWLNESILALRAQPAEVRTLFPAAGRHVGRRQILPASAGDPAPWTADDAARALLLVAMGDAVREELHDLYRFGDADEQRAIVRSLHLLPAIESGADLVLEAARTNDPRLIRVALGPYGFAHLDAEEVAQVALKCVFSGVPLTCIDGLSERATPRLARMLAGFALERVAAGRPVPPDIWPFIDRHPPEDLLASIAAEGEHPVPERREAARAALSQRAATATGARRR